jgi:hypothetical protein
MSWSIFAATSFPVSNFAGMVSPFKKGQGSWVKQQGKSAARYVKV